MVRWRIIVSSHLTIIGLNVTLNSPPVFSGSLRILLDPSKFLYAFPFKVTFDIVSLFLPKATGFIVLPDVGSKFGVESYELLLM